MLLRLLILSVLAVVVYRAAKSWIGGVARKTDRGPGTQTGQVDDVMIKDPVCGTYFVQRKGVSLLQDNQRLDFCSEACRDRYLEKVSADHKSESS
jgi:hypothetical protein